MQVPSTSQQSNRNSACEPSLAFAVLGRRPEERLRAWTSTTAPRTNRSETGRIACRYKFCICGSVAGNAKPRPLGPGHKTSCCIDTSSIGGLLSNGGSLFAISFNTSRLPFVNLTTPPDRVPSIAGERSRPRSQDQRPEDATNFSPEHPGRRPPNRHSATNAIRADAARLAAGVRFRTLSCIDRTREFLMRAPVVMVAADKAKFWPAVILRKSRLLAS